MPKSFRDVKTGSDDGQRWEEDLPFEMKDIRDIAKGEYKAIRLVGYVEPFMRFWIPTEASKAYDPYKTKAKMYPSVCVDFDSATEEFTGNECLYRKAHYSYIDDQSGDTKWDRLKPTKNFLIFFIDRERQEERTGISLKKKVLQSEKFSDIQCATVPTAFAKAVQKAIELYEQKTKKTNCDPTDADEGFDLFFQFDKDAKAEAKYNIQLGDAAPLTKEEKRQATKVPEAVNIYPKDGVDKISASLARAGYLIVESGQTPEEALENKATRKAGAMKAGVECIDDDEEKPRKGKAKAEEEEDFTDEEDDLGLGDDDDGDDFDDDDDAEAEAEAEEKPKKASKKSKKAEEDDFDFDEDGDGDDGDDFDDEDDE
jgi:hypothetical protein